MKKLFILLVVAISLFGIDWSGKVNWAMNYDVAVNLAKSQNKLIMIDISKSDCPPCKYLATKVYTDDEVASYINKHFVPLFYLVDKDNLPVIVENYFTGTTPTIMFLDPNGKLIYNMIGARPPKAFLNTLKSVVGDK